MLIYDNICRKSADQTVALELNADMRLLVVGPLHHVGALDLPGIAVLWYGACSRYTAISSLTRRSLRSRPSSSAPAIRSRRTRRAKSACADRRSPRATGKTRKELHLPFLASGFAAVMSAISTRTASSISPTAEGHDHLRRREHCLFRSGVP
jgi:hypothetical protein